MDGWPFKCWSGCCSQKYRKSPREETRGLENIFPGPLKHTHTKGKREKNLTLISKPDSEYSEIFLTCIIWYFQLKNFIIAFSINWKFRASVKQKDPAEYLAGYPAFFITGYPIAVYPVVSDLVDIRIPYLISGRILDIWKAGFSGRISKASLIAAEPWRKSIIQLCKQR